MPVSTARTSREAGRRAAARADAAPAPPAPRVAVAIVVSRYNRTVTDRLLEGALGAVRDRAGPAAAEAAVVIDAPGAFELPVLAHAAARTGRFRGVLAVGCVIKGQTRHDEYINHAVAAGLVRVGIETGVPACFGVVTAETPGQAMDRAGGPRGNKGRESMEALLDTIEALDRLAGAGSAAAGGDGRLGRPRTRAGAGRRPDKAAASARGAGAGGGR